MDTIKKLGRADIPVLELPESGYPASDAQAWREFGDKYGFFICKLPGIEDLRGRQYDAAAEFFAADNDEKMQLSYKNIDQGPFGNVGFFSMNSETAVSSTMADPKQFFHTGPSSEELIESGREYPKTPWPPNHSKFKLATREMYGLLHNAAERIIRLLAVGYGFDQKQLDNTVRWSNSILRSIHYPLVKHEAKDPRSLAAEHVGIQLLGLQVAPNMGGLQFRLSDDSWVEPIYEEFHDCIFVNIGDMGSYLLSDKIPSTPHRVVQPDEPPTTDRYSTVFFYHPDHAEKKMRLTQGANDNSDTTWGDWLNDRLKELHLLD